MKAGSMHAQASQHARCADSALTLFPVYGDLPVLLPARPSRGPRGSCIFAFGYELLKRFTFRLPKLWELERYLMPEQREKKLLHTTGE